MQRESSTTKTSKRSIIIMSRCCCPLLPITLLVALLLVPHLATAWVCKGSSRQAPGCCSSSLVSLPVPVSHHGNSISTIISRERRRSILVLQESSASSSLDTEDEEEEEDATTAAEKLLLRAEQLRREVESLEQSKRAAVQQRQEERTVEQQTATAVAQRERYSAMVPILKPNGTTVEERVDFSPRYKDGTSYIVTCLAMLPLGIVLGESDEFVGCTMVDEVAAGSNGAIAGLRPGDVLRAITACRVTMETPTWQLVLGGIGVPKTVRFLYAVDHRPFDEVLEAVVSNRQDSQQRPVVLVVERHREQE